MTDSTMATVLEADGQVGLRFVRHLGHAPEKVWRAITESEHLRHWFPCDLVGERAAGATLALPFWPDHVEGYDLHEQPVLDGEIVVWQPYEVFEWLWSTDRLRFELTPDGEGTTLTFTTWLGEAGTGVEQTAAGYHLCFDVLAELLDTGSVRTPLVDISVDRLEQHYRSALADP
jgi:uncharacterized protein YndB with AHSA1/START domain